MEEDNFNVIADNISKMAIITKLKKILGIKDSDKKFLLIDKNKLDYHFKLLSNPNDYFTKYIISGEVNELTYWEQLKETYRLLFVYDVKSANSSK